MTQRLRLLALLGYFLFIIPAGFFIYAKATYNNPKCITTFEGQDSLICKVGGSSNVSFILLGLSSIGLIFAAAMTVKYLRTKSHDTIRK